MGREGNGGSTHPVFVIAEHSLAPMCYSTTLDRDIREMERMYNKRMLEDSRRSYMHPEELENLPDFDAPWASKRTSAFARPFWPVMTKDKPDALELHRWGFLPKQVTDEVYAKEWLKEWATFNAVSEDIEKKKTYAEAWAKGQRCLIPVTSFTEWQHVPVEGRKTPNKIAHDIRTKEEVFTLGGIWEESAMGYRTFSVLTTKANPLMEVIHNTKKRMPVIIPPDMHQFWLSTSLDLDHVKLMCDPYPQEAMEAEHAAA